MSSTYDLDRAGLDAALNVLLDLGVAEAIDTPTGSLRWWCCTAGRRR